MLARGFLTSQVPLPTGFPLSNWEGARLKSDD